MNALSRLIHHRRTTSAVCCRLIHVTSVRLTGVSQTAAAIKDFYALLHASPLCSNEELRDAYIGLAKKYHPDSISGYANAHQFAEVKEAYRRILIQRRELELAASVDEDKQTMFDIKHTAPQHRQYLEYGGAGSGTPSQRQKQYVQQQVVSAADSVLDYRMQKMAAQYETAMVSKDKQATRKRTMRSAIDRLVEDLIAESMAKGDFDNLPGQGKPLRYVHEHPYVDTMTHNINKILINNGYAPPWVTLEKEIRQELAKARDDLQAAHLTAVNSRLLRQKVAEFSEKVAAINGKVDRLNMIVPTLYQQMVRFDVRRELKMIEDKCREPPASAAQQQQQQQWVPEECSTVTLRQLLNELKALFTSS